MFGSSQWMYSSGGFYGTEIDGSLRFNDDDSAYLSRTPASAGNRKTWTWSAWVKRGNLTGTEQHLFTCRVDVSNDTSVWFGSDNKFYCSSNVSGGEDARVSTAMVLRDTSAWYHLVVRFDAANSSLKLYVNGVEATYSNNNQPSNVNHSINSTSLHRLGANVNNVRHFDGYMAEVNFIDGSALDPTSFGETKSGVWIPKAYSGSYGTNGFHLEFAGNTNDSSGNGNNWTANNIASNDYVDDSPTNNFATLNPLDEQGTANTFSNGNLSISMATAVSLEQTRATMGISSGQFYWEATVTSTTNNGGYFRVGFKTDDHHSQGVSSGGYWMVRGADGETEYMINGSASQGSSSVSYGVGDVIMVAVDMDAGKWWAGANGTWVGDPSAGTGAIHTNLYGTVLPFVSNATSVGTHTADVNFGQLGFTYTPPTGYLALSTANLPVAEAVDPAEDNSPQDYFGVVTYTGNGTSQDLTVGFQPDLCILKSRSYSDWHVWTDAVRGNTKLLYSNNTNSEATASNFITSFNSDGVSIGSNGTINLNTATYVGWNWKANGSGVSNTDGSITSTVSANTDAGFSIVSWTGTGSNGSVGHGLSQAPEMIIAKNRVSTSGGVNNWYVYHVSTGADGYLMLNQTNGVDSPNTTVWQGVNPTSSVFYVSTGGMNNSNTDAQISYCFHSVEGFSKFGSYTGNGSSDGPFVYTGFRPAMIIVKNASQTDNWFILDDKRNAQNTVNSYLMPNQSNAEDANNSTVDTDFVSNGFKLRATSSAMNGSGNTLIYMAFAENPFKYANAR